MTTFPAQKIQEAVENLAQYIIDHFTLTDGDVALVGIQRRGVLLAERVARSLSVKKKLDIPVGAIDITLYRDDVTTSGIQTLVGETQLDFGVDNKRIILIDDVLFTGRTVRAALDEIMDFGRPKSVSLLVLIDRGHRELPIEPQYAAIKISTRPEESVDLRLKEIDEKEEIQIGEPSRK
ncbi:MAG: Bifunctional protein PyrR [Elusimicrobia bacterium]|nr:Bifunctional protein PyrR [Elusimicrobiota bacterium]